MCAEQRRRGRPPGTGYGGQIRTLTEDELARFLHQCQRQGRREDAMFHLAWFFAMRVGEVVALRLSDLNPSSRQITIRAEKHGLTRTYDVPEPLWRKLDLWLRRRAKLPGAEENPWLFPGLRYPHSEHLGRDALQAAFRELCRKAGIPGRHSIHELRATWATMRARQGDGIVQIAGWLRHREISSSQPYIDHAQDKAHEARMARWAEGMLR